MSLQNRLAYNPFLFVKVRSLFIWFFLYAFIVAWPLLLFQGITRITDFKSLDPIVELVCGIISVNILFYGWIFWLFIRFQISPRLIFGGWQNNYNWLLIIGFVVCLYMLRLGCFYALNYLLSFIAPSYVDSILKPSSLFTFNAKTSLPILYNILLIYNYLFLIPVASQLVFVGIMLHRFAIKWGIRTGVLVSSLVAAIYHFKGNILGGFIYFIVLNLTYIKTRSLVFTIICDVSIRAIFLVPDIISAIQNRGTRVPTVEQFRSNLGIGLVFLILSTPILIRFIYKNWPSQISEAPYFRGIYSNTANQEYSDDFS